MTDEVEVAKEGLDSQSENKDTVQYEIVDGDIDGLKVRGVRANGNVIFTVAETFSDEQIQEVFNLSNKFFNDGFRFGAGQKEAQLQQLIGLTPNRVAELVAAAGATTEDEDGGSAVAD